MFDAVQGPSSDDEEFYRELIASGKQVIALYNKTDLVDVDKIQTSDIFEKKIFVSAKTGDGIEALAKLVNELYIDGSISLHNDAVVMDNRQYSALLSSQAALERAIFALDSDLPLDLCAVDIEAAMVNIGEVDGREVGEDIVANIFSRFCVGK